MQQINLHQQRLYALIEAALALIGCFLTWMVASSGFASKSTNGFTSWGLISVAGIIGVVIASLLGDKSRPYDPQTKMIAMASFGAIAVGAIAYFIRIMTLGGQQTNGFYVVNVKTTAGAGLWMTLVAGLIGLAWVGGLIAKIAPASTSPMHSGPAPSMPGSTPMPPPGNMPPPPPPPPGTMPPPPPSA